MSIEEEIKKLENALSGALLVPSECAFVSTEIISICLDVLRNYESWENLIRYEIEKQIRADAIDEFADTLLSRLPNDIDAMIPNSSLVVEISYIAEQLKESKNEINSMS